MNDKARNHIMAREITRTSNVLRRGRYVHHENAIWRRDPQRFYEVSPGSMALAEIELGRRVTYAQTSQLINLRVHGSPWSPS